MKTQKYTEGPWTDERMFNPPKAKDRTCGFVVNGPENGEALPDRICDLRVPPGLRFQEYQANARLISSAPDLVEALINCIETLEAAKIKANAGCDWIATIEARAALRKAGVE